MSKLWEVKSHDGVWAWTVLVRCESPFVAIEAATNEHPWQPQRGVSVREVPRFIDATSRDAPGKSMEVVS